MTTDQAPAYSKEFVDSLLKACVDYRSQVDQLERENAALRAALDTLLNKVAEAAKSDNRTLHDFERIALAVKEAQP